MERIQFLLYSVIIIPMVISYEWILPLEINIQIKKINKYSLINKYAYKQIIILVFTFHITLLF